MGHNNNHKRRFGIFGRRATNRNHDDDHATEETPTFRVSIDPLCTVTTTNRGAAATSPSPLIVDKENEAPREMEFPATQLPLRKSRRFNETSARNHPMTATTVDWTKQPPPPASQRSSSYLDDDSTQYPLQVHELLDRNQKIKKGPNDEPNESWTSKSPTKKNNKRLTSQHSLKTPYRKDWKGSNDFGFSSVGNDDDVHRGSRHAVSSLAAVDDMSMEFSAKEGCWERSYRRKPSEPFSLVNEFEDLCHDLTYFCRSMSDMMMNGIESDDDPNRLILVQQQHHGRRRQIQQQPSDEDTSNYSAFTRDESSFL